MGLDCGCVWMCVSECQCAFSRIMGIVTFRVKLCIYNSFHFCHLYQYHHHRVVGCRVGIDALDLVHPCQPTQCTQSVDFSILLNVDAVYSNGLE